MSNVNRFENFNRSYTNHSPLNESIINTKSFKNIKVKAPCHDKIFNVYPNMSFIIVLDKGGSVVLYENGSKNTFKNLREFISLFGSKFFRHSIKETNIGMEIIKQFEESTGSSVRDIYMYDL